MSTGNNSTPIGYQPAEVIDSDSPAGRLVTAIYGPGHKAMQNGHMTWILPTSEGNTDPTDTDEDMRIVLDEWLEAADRPYDSPGEAINGEAGRETIRFNRGGTITAILERARKRINHNQSRER